MHPPIAGVTQWAAAAGPSPDSGKLTVPLAALQPSPRIVPSTKPKNGRLRLQPSREAKPTKPGFASGLGMRSREAKDGHPSASRRFLHAMGGAREPREKKKKPPRRTREKICTVQRCSVPPEDLVCSDAQFLRDLGLRATLVPSRLPMRQVYLVRMTSPSPAHCWPTKLPGCFVYTGASVPIPVRAVERKSILHRGRPRRSPMLHTLSYLCSQGSVLGQPPPHMLRTSAAADWAGRQTSRLPAWSGSWVSHTAKASGSSAQTLGS